MDVDTTEVLDAASTKWNTSFKPGLVGGHCIGVDPYYLAYKAAKIGYQPEIILSGRKTNESMPQFIFDKIKEKLNFKKNENKDILILGAAFKENCPDIRNSKSQDLYNIFKYNRLNCKIHDAVADVQEMKSLYEDDFIEKIDSIYDAVIIAVGHNEYMNLNFEKFTTIESVIFDVKSIFPKSKGFLRL